MGHSPHTSLRLAHPPPLGLRNRGCQGEVGQEGEDRFSPIVKPKGASQESGLLTQGMRAMGSEGKVLGLCTGSMMQWSGGTSI